LDALTPKVALNVEGEDARIDSRFADERVCLGYFLMTNEAVSTE